MLTSVDILINPQSVRDLISFIDDILGAPMTLGMKERFEDAGRLSELHTQALGIVQVLVYDAYPDNSGRTQSMLQSVKVSTGNTDQWPDAVSEVCLYLDPNVSPAKIPSGPDQSYGAFFERPDDFNTFIQPRGIKSPPVNYRPFFDEWVRTNTREQHRNARDAVNGTLRELQPIGLRRRS